MKVIKFKSKEYLSNLEAWTVAERAWDFPALYNYANKVFCVEDRYINRRVLNDGVKVECYNISGWQILESWVTIVSPRQVLNDRIFIKKRLLNALQEAELDYNNEA